MRPPGIVLVTTGRLRALLGRGISDAAQSLGGHLQETGYVYHGGSQHYLGFLSEQSLITLRSILESLAVSMLLATDGHVLQYLAVEHLHLLVAHHQIM